MHKRGNFHILCQYYELVRLMNGQEAKSTELF